MHSIKIPLSELKEGMKIKSFHDDKICYKQVSNVWDTEVKAVDQIKLEFTNGTIIHCSVNHPIMVLENDNVVGKKPEMLTEFDQIITENDLTYLYERTISQTNNTRYIDITVDDTNVFFTADSNESEMVLTHNSQGGIRRGSATVTIPLWTYEIEDLLVLKNNKGIDENRVRNLDYCIQFNKLMYERLITNQYITLFSTSEVPELYNAFISDQDKFKDLYEKAERSHIRKKKIKAQELFGMFMQERKDTGRIYLMNIDNANIHSSFNESKKPVSMTNLCTEIDLYTKPLLDINDGAKITKIKVKKENLEKFHNNTNGILFRSEVPELFEFADSTTNATVDDYELYDKLVEDPDPASIAQCILSAVNWGVFKRPEDMERACTLAVRGLDALISYQHYPVLAGQVFTEKYRPIGVGIINFAYFLAKNDVKYSDDSALELVDTWTQHWSYYLIKASADLAKDFGACPGFNDTKYSNNLLPIDTYKKEVDELIPFKPKVDWDSLRQQIKETGIRNSTLCSLMPSETSSQIANATNGVEPPRSYVSIKQSKDGVLRQVVPEYRRLKNKYELLWDQKSPLGYIKLMCVMQRYIDQGISVNTSYNPEYYKDEKVPMSEMLQHILLFYKWGGKQLYYLNTHDGQGEIDVDKNIEEDEQCDSCAI